MSDTIIPTPPAGGAATGAQADTAPVNEALGEAGLSALRAERAANKELKAELKKLADQVQAAEDKDLSELAKFQKKAAEWQAKAEGYEKAKAVDALKAEIAAKAGVPADLLAGDDEASISAFAAKLAAHLGPQKPQPNPFLQQSGNAGTAGDTEADALSALGFGPS